MPYRSRLSWPVIFFPLSLFAIEEEARAQKGSVGGANEWTTGIGGGGEREGKFWLRLLEARAWLVTFGTLARRPSRSKTRSSKGLMRTEWVSQH